MTAAPLPVRSPAAQAFGTSRVILRAFLAACLAVLLIQTLALEFPGKVRRDDRMADWYAFHIAGQLTSEGRAAANYDYTALQAEQKARTGKQAFMPWAYPPPFTLATAPLALLPAAWSYLVTQLALLGWFLLVVRRAAGPNMAAALAAALPAIVTNLACGQNGFLTTALLATGLALLVRRPILAGIALGCLAYKPQVAVLIPVALIAGGQWRVLFATAATVILLCLAAYAAFGPETWKAFFASFEPTRTIVLEQGQTGWPKIVSVFSATRMLGGDLPLAYALQTAVSAAVLAAMALLWWKRPATRLAAGCLILAIPLTTPYVLDYDLVVLAAGTQLLGAEGVATGFRPWEKAALALVTLGPLLARMIGTAAGLPIMPPILILTIAIFALRLGTNAVDRRIAVS